MQKDVKAYFDRVDSTSPIFMEGSFTRLDESEDGVFYAKERFVSHLDSLALSTVGKIIQDLVVEDDPSILDLMSGPDSHIPETLKPARVVGLGLNEKELRQNKALTERVIHDLNRNPDLPFPDKTFDAVINTVSVDYMTKPIKVFAEVGRILKPGGLFLVIFSNRMFPQKAVKIWNEASEEERVIFVEEFFHLSVLFERPKVFASRGKPRPKDDKYAPMGIPSDPVYAVYAEKKGCNTVRKARPYPRVNFGEPLDEKELPKREKNIKKTLKCPYCGEKMNKWAVPHNPFACIRWRASLFPYVLCDG